MVSQKALILALCVAASTVGAGIYGVTAAQPLSALTLGEPDPVSYDYPERPAPVNESNVIPFAIDYEEAVIYDQLLANQSGTISDFDFACEGYLAEIHMEGEYLVTLQCAYTYHTQTDGKTAIVDGVPYSVTYRITDNNIERSEQEGRSSDPAGDTAVSTLSPRELPTKPTPLTATSVGSYAAAYEEVWKYNEVLSAHSGETLANVSTRCTVSAQAATNERHSVILQCGYTYTVETDRGVAVVDGVPYDLIYTIDETTTMRDSAN